MAEKVFTRNHCWDDSSFLSAPGADQVLWLKRLALWSDFKKNNGKNHKYFYKKAGITPNQYIQHFFLALSSFRELKKKFKTIRDELTGTC